MADWLSGFLQAIFASFIWELLLAAGVAALIAYLRATKERWAGPVIYGLAAFAIVFVIGYTLTGQPLLSRTQSQTTPENIEANIKAWADDFQLGITKMPPRPDIDFGLVITTKGSNNPVEIRKLKQSPAYIQLQSNLALSPEHQKIVAKLTEEQSTFVTEEVELELAHTGMGFTIVGAPRSQTEPQIQLVVLGKGVPIAGLTESAFANAIDAMDSAIRVSQSTTALLLDHGPLHDAIAKPHPIPPR
jgi:hypothetical protein